MSIVGVAIENGNIVIAGDTRVIKKSKFPNEVESRFDFAVKIFVVSPNVLLGIVDDYNTKTIQIIKEVKEELGKTDFAGNYYWGYRHDIIASKVSKVISKFSSASQDIILAIHDIRSKKRYAYNLLQILNHKPYLIERIGFIGLAPSYHEEMKNVYQNSLKRNNPKTLEDYANSFLESFKAVKDITINNFPICNVIHSNGIMTISNGTGYIREDGNVDWVVNTIDEYGNWIRKVNNKFIGKIISDINLIEKHLITELK